MKLPSVYPLTIPSSQRMIRMIAIVSSMPSSPLPAPVAPAGFRGCNLSTAVARVVVLAAVLGVHANASAQTFSDGVKMVAGAAAAFALHEGAHVIADVAFGANPGLKKVSFGPLPFFAVTHEPVSAVEEFVISSAGIWAQHLENELVLTTRPDLRREHAPVLKGVVIFNVLTSVAYSAAAFARAGPDERDTRGMALSARLAEPVVGAVILAPALLDGARYYGVRSRWVMWGSRAAKIGATLLILRAAS